MRKDLGGGWELNDTYNLCAQHSPSCTQVYVKDAPKEYVLTVSMREPVNHMDIPFSVVQALVEEVELRSKS